MNSSVFTKWLELLGKAWITRDPDIAASICAKNVVYYEDPFQKPLKGRPAVRKIWEEVPKTQKNISFTYDIITVYNQTGIAHWSASYTSVSSGTRETLDGVFIVTLDKKGLCEEFRMWWNTKT